MSGTFIIRPAARRTAQALLLSASALAVASPAHAAQVLFSTDSDFEIETGRRVNQAGGVTQIRLDNGATLSFVEDADYRINDDGTVDLYAGTVTVAGADGGATLVRMPEGVEGQVMGAGSAASFSVAADGAARGHTLTGNATIRARGGERGFDAGQMWAAKAGEGLRRVVSNGAQVEPGSTGEGAVRVAAIREGGPLAAAENGLPVSLGDGLASAGASSDIVNAARRVDAAVANPDIATFPTGDVAQLVSYAAQLSGGHGGALFSGSQAGVIRAYLGFLADGGSGADFVTAYSGFLAQYLDLIRAGALPSSFTGTNLADLDAFIGYLGSTSGFAGLSAENQALIDAYLSFLAAGGNRDLFARSYTDLVGAYFDYLRAGGDPLEFAGATQQTLGDYIAFLSDSGLATQLSAADQALLNAWLANGGLAFTSQYHAALSAYFDYLAQGKLPSGYTALDAQTLQAYLEALQSTGLFADILGDEADFYSAYLAYLQDGGDPDAFAGLNANVFTGYAAALDAYYDYLLKGGQPSEYGALTQQQVAAYVAALQGAGASGTFLGNLADFYSGYLAFVQGGGNPDVYTGLPVLNLPAFADALNAYADFLANGGFPSAYSGLDLATLATYLDALDRSGQIADLLGANADLLDAYFAYRAGGGGLDGYSGLPVYADYAAALNAYYSFLADGGLPRDYTALTAAQVQAYLAALGNAGGIAAQLGGESGSFFTAYFAFLAAGGDPQDYSELPVYAGYASALQAYYNYLKDGGLPADYSGLTQAQVKAYLAALQSAGGFTLQLGGGAGDFFDDYYAYLASGGAPGGYSGLPIYAGYVEALNAYYAFLADGGLPGDYTALTSAQVEAYLAALQAAGGFAAYGELADFFGAYYSYLAGGGDPASYAGLPVYADYLAAVQAYYTYLAGGGLPSGYSALSQAEIEDYLQALADAGLLDASFTGEELSFYTGYLAWLSGGGVPDDFADLPDIPPPPSVTHPAALAYQGGFDSSGGATVMAHYSGYSGINQKGVTLGGDGALLGADDDYFVPDGGGSVDVQGDALGLLGRFTGGNLTLFETRGFSNIGADTGAHWVVLAPSTGTMPVSGTVDYDLIAATHPTLTNGAVAPGRFEGDLSLAFDAASISGSLAGRIELSESDGDHVYSFDHDFTTDAASIVSGLYFYDYQGVSGEGIACPTAGNCSVNISLAAGGTNGADRVGVTYETFGGSLSTPRITGAALFGVSGSWPAEGSTEPPATVSTAYGEHPLIVFKTAYVNDFGSNTVGAQLFPGNDLQKVLVNADGELEAFAEDRTQSYLLQVNRKTASIAEVYDKGTMQLGRWSGGIVDYYNYPDIDLGPNQGLHYVISPGVDTFDNLPSGTVSYSLLAATSPTLASGSMAPGTFDAEVAIAFGATPKIGIEGTMVFTGADGFTYSFSTPGGVAAPGKAFTWDNSVADDNGSFYFQADGTTDTGLEGQTNFYAVLGDEEAAQFGTTYSTPLFDTDSAYVDAIVGGALFGMDGSSPGGSGGSGGAASETRSGQVTYTLYSGSLASAGGGDSVLEDGKLTSVTTIYGTVTPTTAQIAEGADYGDVAWARWTGGDVVTTGLVPSTVSVGASEGYYVLSGTPTTSLPASGKVDYELLSAAAVTDNRGSAPGTMTGDVAIQFGATSHVGFDMKLAVGGKSWEVATPGGVADPSQGTVLLLTSPQPSFKSTFHSNQSNVIATGGACAFACMVNVGGYLYGDNGKYAGVGVTVFDTQNDGALTATGIAVFGAQGSQYQYNPYAYAPGDDIAVAQAQGWDRFESQNAAAAGLSAQPPQVPLSAAQASAMLGGSITFGGK